MSEEQSGLWHLWGERLNKLCALYQKALGDPPGFAVKAERERVGKSFVNLFYTGEGWESLLGSDYVEHPKFKEDGACVVSRLLLRITDKVDLDVLKILGGGVERVRQQLGAE